MIEELMTALITVMQPQVLLWIFIGVCVGLVFGAFPGLTATTGVAIFTPLTFYMEFNQSMALLLGIFCGGFYAGSIPAILINTPGAPGNAATVLDGYTMAAKGRAGEALALSIISSVFGGIFSAVALIAFAPLIGSFATRFGAAEYFAVGLLGLVCVASVSGKSFLKGIIAAALGMLIATVGMDPISGIYRFTFDNMYLSGGITMLPALIGLFAISEVFVKAENYRKDKQTPVIQVSKITSHFKNCFNYKWLMVKSSIIGMLVGALPGTGPTIASWVSYNEAKRTSKHPEEFGQGTPEGLIASEASNNAVTGGAMIPLLTLGIPGDTVTAILLGALMIQGLTPGPMLIENNFNILASILMILVVSNLFMLVMGLLASKLFPYISKTPDNILIPLIVVLCITGGYASANSFFDVLIVAVLGLLGFVMIKFGIPIPPLVLGLVLGPIIEPNFRRALVAADMNFMAFLERPIFLSIMALTAIMLYFLRKSSKV